jgi:hypothetical protein
MQIVSLAYILKNAKSNTEIGFSIEIDLNSKTRVEIS